MKQLFSIKAVIVCLLLFAGMSAFSSTISADTTAAGGGSTKPPKTSMPPKTKKDNQNQTQYLKKDLGQKDFNLNDRTAINKPQMPHYDVPSDSAEYMKGTSRNKQQDAYINHKYYYPAKPKNQWEVGLGVGSFILSGDVTPVGNPLKSYGATFTVRKAFGYVFSLRGQYVFGHAVGLDWKPKANTLRNPVLNGSLDSKINYKNKSILPNYKMYSPWEILNFIEKEI